MSPTTMGKAPVLPKQNPLVPSPPPATPERLAMLRAALSPQRSGWPNLDFDRALVAFFDGIGWKDEALSPGERRAAEILTVATALRCVGGKDDPGIELLRDMLRCDYELAVRVRDEEELDDLPNQGMSAVFFALMKGMRAVVENGARDT